MRILLYLTVPLMLLPFMLIGAIVFMIWRGLHSGFNAANDLFIWIAG